MAHMRETGWRKLVVPGLVEWAFGARNAAIEVLDRSGVADWRCGGTWFPGVNALPTDCAGALPGGPALPAGLLPMDLPLHPAQLSVTRPGYPRRSGYETDAAFGYRLRRDSAHLDGLLPIGRGRRRMIREPHAYVLGIGLGEADPGAAPLVVWSGSHLRTKAALLRALSGEKPDRWHEVDVTEAYQAARREVFETCPRVPVPLAAGEAVLLHRHLLHGVAPWQPGAKGEAAGRLSAYFRPLLPSVPAWLAEDPA